MHHAALDGRAGCIRALLEAGVSPDAIDQYFSTPLHHAAGQGHPDCVALLLNAGADVNDRCSEFGAKTDNISGVTIPLDIGCSCGYDSGWHSNSLSLSQMRQTGGRQQWHLN